MYKLYTEKCIAYTSLKLKNMDSSCKILTSACSCCFKQPNIAKTFFCFIPGVNRNHDVIS